MSGYSVKSQLVTFEILRSAKKNKWFLLGENFLTNSLTDLQQNTNYFYNTLLKQNLKCIPLS